MFLPAVLDLQSVWGSWTGIYGLEEEEQGSKNEENVVYGIQWATAWPSHRHKELLSFGTTQEQLGDTMLSDIGKTRKMGAGLHLHMETSNLRESLLGG